MTFFCISYFRLFPVECAIHTHWVNTILNFYFLVNFNSYCLSAILKAEQLVFCRINNISFRLNLYEIYNGLYNLWSTTFECQSCSLWGLCSLLHTFFSLI